MSDNERLSAARVSLMRLARLRKQAEEIHRRTIARKPELLAAGLSNSPRHVLHELNVHQIELELQNEELHRTHRELSASRESYLELYNLAPVGFCSVDDKGIIVQGNLTLANMLGVERYTLAGRHFSHFVERGDQDVFYFLKKRFVTDAVQSCELRMLRADGCRFWASVSARAALDQEGMPILRIALDDVSVRKEAEERFLQSERELHGLRLLEKERQLHGILDTAMDAIIAVDEALDIVLFNPAAAAMFGVPAAEAVGQPIDRFLPSRFRSVYEKEMQACGGEAYAARSAGQSRKIAGLRAGGEEFPIEAKISQTKVGGKLLCTAIMRDLTQENMAETALNLSRQKLHELIARRQRDGGGRHTHAAGEIQAELGRLLAAIKDHASQAGAELGQVGLAHSERIDEACATIESAVAEVRRLIVGLHPSVLDVLGIWDALEWLAEETGRHTGLRCAIAIDAAAADAEVDLGHSTALFQILQAALAHLVRHANTANVDVRVGIRNRVIRMAIDDNGMGIDVKSDLGYEMWEFASVAALARQFAGELKIAKLSSGLRITLRLPLE
ncbi:MAG: PAS domain S-box protein [Burkholderiaceae bacterium]|nr:PAS domain S-box protein [Burkholderiaceae bacterium]